MVRFRSLCAMFFFAVLTLSIVGCDKSTNTTGGDLSTSAKYSNAPLGVILPKSSVHQEAVVVDSLRITRARFVLKDLKFKMTDDTLDYKTEAFVVELNLSESLQQLTVQSVPFGSYTRIEFDVHRVDSSDVNGFSPAAMVPFADFLAGERYSVIIDGLVYKDGGSGAAFRYRSKIDAQQKFDLIPPLVVSESDPAANVSMVVSSANWFYNGSGNLVDPSDSNNEGVIDENIKNSIKAFKDDDHNGVEDPL